MSFENLVGEGFQLSAEPHDNDSNLVMIADDCSFNIVALQSLLLQFNIKSDFCVNGLEAIQLVKERQKSRPAKPMYKLILMDFSMPECDGPAATNQIREYLTKKKSETQPMICCCTAYSET